jgi:galactokinase
MNHMNTFSLFTPGRVNLIGEHTDYNEGLVLPMAIEKGIVMKVIRRDDRLAVLRSDHQETSITLDLTNELLAGEHHWSCYLQGVIAGFQRLGWEIPGFECDISATLPSGGGLSSSAALEVGMATVIETLCERKISLEEKALLCQKAEHEFAGVPCGIMDQFAVTFGKADHALLLDCRDRQIEYVPLDPQVAILVINCGVKHSLADGEYAQRRSQCEQAASELGVSSLRDVSWQRWQQESATLSGLVRQRAQHVLSEHQRTLTFVEALKNQQWQSAGAAMYASHESLRDDYAVSCAELDQLVEISRLIAGVHGCRMTGGGFGGCVVALIDPHHATAIMAAFREQYLQQTGIDAEMFVTRAANGPLVEVIA